MRSASYRHSANPQHTPARRRAIALLLTLAVHVLILIILLKLAPAPAPPPRTERMPVTFHLLPEPARTRTFEKKASSGARPQVHTPAVIKPPPVTPPTPPLPFVTMSRQDFAAADIASLPSHSGEGESASTGAGKDNSAVYGPGEGPGGVQLYEADWYRKPTDAELATYLPANAPPNGWGLVACKTVEHYHVENCQALGESPIGSGLARAVRLAAWQFLVRPPRIDGRPLVGAWVRIRIDYTQRAAK